MTPADTLREALEHRALLFSTNWGAGGSHAVMMAAFAAKEVAASEPVAGTVREADDAREPVAWQRKDKVSGRWVPVPDHMANPDGFDDYRIGGVDVRPFSTPPAPAGREEIARIIREVCDSDVDGDFCLVCADRILSTVTPQGRSTPAARWRDAGNPDPHGTRYDCERAKLPGGDLTDDELANQVFLEPNIANLTLAKERIRWLSRQIYATPPAPGAADRERNLRRLVIAARAVCFDNQGPDALRALDKASEAFSELVAWENDPNDEVASANTGEADHG